MESVLDIRSYMDPVTENAVAGLHAGLCWTILDKCLRLTNNNSPYHNNCEGTCSCTWVRENLQRLGWADRARADAPLYSPDHNYSAKGEGRKTFSLQLPSILQHSNSEIMFLVSISLPWPLPPLALRSDSQRSHFLDDLQKHTVQGISAYTYVYDRSPPPLSVAPPAEIEAKGDINRDGNGDDELHVPEDQEQRDGDDDILMPDDYYEDVNNNHMILSDEEGDDDDPIEEVGEEGGGDDDDPIEEDGEEGGRDDDDPVEDITVDPPTPTYDEPPPRLSDERKDDPGRLSRPFKLRRIERRALQL